MGNSYTALRRLATHPCFDMNTGVLSCPLCRLDAKFTTSSNVNDFDEHLAGHSPSREIAGALMSWSGYDRYRRRRGWPDRTLSDEQAPDVGPPTPPTSDPPFKDAKVLLMTGERLLCEACRTSESEPKLRTCPQCGAKQCPHFGRRRRLARGAEWRCSGCELLDVLVGGTL